MEGKVRKLESMQEYQDLLNPRLYKICLMIEEGLVVHVGVGRCFQITLLLNGVIHVHDVRESSL